MTAWGGTADTPVANRLRDARLPGIIGIGLGAFAALLTIPPIEARSITWSLLVGVVGAMLGIWTITRGRRRLGWGAVAAGIFGIGLALLAIQSSTTNLGYTFDWAPRGTASHEFQRFGESEFVIPAGAPIEVIGATSTAEYCR